MTRPECASCVFWNRLARGVGECRRYPPVIVHTPDRPSWPQTKHSDWCGEHTVEAWGERE